MTPLTKVVTRVEVNEALVNPKASNPRENSPGSRRDWGGAWWTVLIKSGYTFLSDFGLCLRSDLTAPTNVASSA